MHNGFAIAIAWPETPCKQASAWYDILLYHLRINKTGYYKVGHAAIVLIDDETLSCQYYDFGRYHTPHGHGRVRNKITDHDLNIETKAKTSIDKEDLCNLDEILTELHGNGSTHGLGTIYGTVTRINFDVANEYAKQLNEHHSIPYGPFIPHGTNCSRFVNKVVQYGTPYLLQKIKLQLPITLTPTPMWNLRAIGNKIISIGDYVREEENISIQQESKVVIAQ